MKIKQTYLKLIGLFLIFGTIIFLVIGPLLPRLVDISTYQQQIITLLERSLNRKISLGELRFVWRLGPEFIIKDLHLRERDSSEEFLSARTVTFHLRLLPLLHRQVALRSVEVDGLKARLIRNHDGSLNIDDLIAPRPDAIDLNLSGIKLHKADLSWLDQSCSEGPLALQLADIDLSLEHLTRGKKANFKLSATLGNGKIKGSGTVTVPKAKDLPARKLAANAKLELTQLDYSRLWPYYGHYIPFDRPGGTLDLEVQIKGTPDDFSAKGLVRLHNARVVWPAVFHGPVAPGQAQLQFNLKRTLDYLDLSSLQLNADGFAFRGSLKLSDLRTSDPYLSAKGVTEPFEYQQVRSYIPFGIIGDDAADFIEHKIKAGRFKLNTGTLEGRFSKLARFTEGDNAQALFISGTAEQAVVSYGPAIPSFNQVKGTLELKGRHFNLHRMSGSFGGSPFTLEGSITEYCTLNVPSEYPFRMEISPKPAEVAWLARLVGADQLTFSGTAPLRLEGAGPTTAYRLSGNWQLAQATYEFPAIVRKPVGMVNSLSFSSVLTKRETRITSLSYSLAPLQLSALGTFRHGGTVPHLAFEVQSNVFNLTPQLPLLPDWQKFQPKGAVQAHVTGSGDPRDFSAMQYKGAIRLSSFSFKPMEDRPPLTAINGLVTFKGNSLETSRIAVRYGSSALELRGRIASLKEPEAELFINSPELHPGDLSDKLAEAPVIRQFSANIGLRKGLYTIRNIAGRLPRSSFSAAGTVRPKPEPDIALRIASSYLDIEELLPLLAPPAPPPSDRITDSTPKQAAVVKPFQLHGVLTAESGVYRGLTFSKLKAQLRNDGGILRLQELQAGLFGGQLFAKGQLERVTGQPHKWTLNLALERIKSDDLLHALGINRETSGLMTIRGNLRAQGETLDELKRTATGNLSLTIERGKLHRFSTLAKVFSLLNVSQLLSFQLPDMVKEGMPFNQITATIGVKDGVLSSQDFFINSNAMHLSLVGKINIVKEDLDLLIGVQPLQTVDKVISRIPVVGWILTGGDGSLITTYFEAKGSWADPQVTAIPVKSIASGTLEIFRRVFELPVRLFTDSGEVLLGQQKERPKAKEE